MSTVAKAARAKLPPHTEPLCKPVKLSPVGLLVEEAQREMKKRERVLVKHEREKVEHGR